ncbi:hypothetical protein [Kyrpidia spormannii]|nr:hypothetical protein [Kyrpidia spormannii]
MMAFAGAAAYSRYLGRWVAVRCYSGRVYRGVLHEARPDGLVLYQPGGVWASAPGQNRTNLVYADGSLRPEQTNPSQSVSGSTPPTGAAREGSVGTDSVFRMDTVPAQFFGGFFFVPAFTIGVVVPIGFFW